VVVPVRNEETRLPLLLRSLAAQDYPNYQVLVVDDGSKDGTLAVASAGGAETLAAGQLPPTWTGKAWACWTGARAATGERLVFLDADTTLAPGGLARMLAEHARVGGLLSVQPYHAVEKGYERLSAFLNVVQMMGTGAFTPRGERLTPVGAFGPCLVCDRDDYFRVGGHAVVRQSVLEDVALARRFAECGLPVRCLGGRGTVAYRMYPEGWRQLVEGWSKNIAGGALAIGLPWLPLVIGWVTGCGGAAVAALQAIVAGPAELSAPRRVAAVLLYSAYAAQIGWMLRRVGSFGWWPAALYPLPLLTFLGIFLRSLILTIFVGSVRWKDREISTGRTVRAGRL
jgi:4,4'-diaponeurosporenoate glycosyltransferase